MPAKNGFELQDGDIELLRFAHELRIAQVEHFRTLTGRSKLALWRRLRKLRERRYLASAARFMQQHIYTIGSAGVPVLIEQGYAERTLAEKRVRYRELNEIGLRHALHITNIHTRLLMLTRGTPLKIAVWREGPALWDTVLPKKGKAAIPIRPDIYLGLQNMQRPEGKNMLHFFIEADRGTMSHERMVQKVIGYLAYHDDHRFGQKYPGMKSFHVITVTETRGRAASLRDGLGSLITTAPLQRAYRFVAIEDLTLEAFLPKVAT
jgi:hypothetical protein